jgi:Peptidase family M28
MRLARVSALLLLVPLTLVTLTVAQPGPLPAPALPPAFDADTAVALATELANDHSRRVPGSPGALEAARWVEEKFALYGLDVQVDRWHADLADLGGAELTNVLAVVPGQTKDAVVVVAHRDTSERGPGANDNASGTAALIELARSYGATGTAAGRARPQHTLIFLSTDGGAYGSAGAARFARSKQFGRRVLAAVVLDGLAGTHRPRLELAGDNGHSPAPALVQTAAARIVEQTRREPDRPNVLRQLVDLALPFAYGDQGSLLGGRISAIRLGTADDTGKSDALDVPERLDELRFARLGRAAHALLASLDGGAELVRGSSSYLVLQDRFVRGWAIAALLVVTLVPYLAVVIDFIVRSRRRGVALVPALRSLRSRLLVALWCGLLLWVGALAGVLPTGDPRPLPPAGPSATDWPLAGLVVIGLLALSGWLAARPRLLRQRVPSLDEELAGYAVALAALGIVALGVAVVSPLALLFVLPSLYAWLWLVQLHATGPRWAKDVLFGLGFAGPVLALVSLGARFDLGLDTVLYVAGLASVGYLPWTRVVLFLAWAAIAAQLGSLIAGRYAPYANGLTTPPRGVVRNGVRRAVLAAQARRR